VNSGVRTLVRSGLIGTRFSCRAKWEIWPGTRSSNRQHREGDSGSCGDRAVQVGQSVLPNGRVLELVYSTRMACDRSAARRAGGNHADAHHIPGSWALSIDDPSVVREIWGKHAPSEESTVPLRSPLCSRAVALGVLIHIPLIVTSVGVAVWILDVITPYFAVEVRSYSVFRLPL